MYRQKSHAAGPSFILPVEDNRGLSGEGKPGGVTSHVKFVLRLKGFENRRPIMGGSGEIVKAYSLSNIFSPYNEKEVVRRACSFLNETAA